MAERPGRDSDALPAEVEQGATTITARDLRAIVGFLADDLLQGRGTGHPGNEIAAAYLAKALAVRGVDPLFGESHRQPVALVAPSLGDRNFLELRGRGRRSGPAERHVPGEHLQPLPASPSREASGRVVFAGFGIHAPEHGHDDYAGLPVTGRLVLVLDGTPAGSEHDDPLALSTREHGRLATKARVAADRGAVGLLVVAADGDRRLRDLRDTWPDQPSVRDRELVRPEHQLPIPAARVSGQLATAVLRQGGVSPSLDRLRDEAVAAARSRAGAAGAGRPVHEGDASVTLAVDLRHAPVTAFNVIGALRGTDPLLRDDWVVVGAHFDHDGLDASGRIYNGADDNASGTAGVLEIAEAFGRLAELGIRPARTVVFALWDAEERGLLGSLAFVDAVGSNVRLVANLNLDMIGRDEHVVEGDRRFTGLAPTRGRDTTNALHLLGYSYSPDLAALARRENAAIGLDLRTELDRGAHRLVQRSDHWSFLRAGVPALFLFTGLHPDYHTPEDDAAALNFDKMERIVRLAFRMAWRLATTMPPPAFVEPLATPTPLP